MQKRVQEYRRLAAECLRLAGTTDDANSHAQYTALAQMWAELAEEAEARQTSFRKVQDARIVQQQEQWQPEKPKRGKSKPS